MTNQILVPSLGESVSEATVSKWLKQVGEKVDSDEPLVELETDKVNIEVPSPSSGTLTSIKVKEGDTVEVGTLLAVVNEAKSSSVANTKEINDQPQVYIPPQAVQKKNIGKKNKRTNLRKQEPLKLTEAVEEKNKREDLLILNTLADKKINNSDLDLENRQEQEHILLKTKQSLSPAVRKIVKENKIDISNLRGTEKGG